MARHSPPTPVAAPETFAPAPLVGRGRELSRLLATMEHAPAVCLVEGEPGIGKTRLIAELLRLDELRGRQALVGACHRMGEPFFLGPVVEALRGARLPSGLRPAAVTGSLRPLLPELGDRLPADPGPLPDAGAERHRLLRALRELIGGLGPAIVVLEDLHWADPATLELLEVLLADLPRDLALVTTLRREDLPAGSRLPALLSRPREGMSWLHLALEPLSRKDVRTLAGSMLGTGELSDAFSRYLHRRTGGLPLAVEEVMRLLQERRDIVAREGRWERRAIRYLEVPPAMRDLVLERVQSLSPEARDVVRAAAVLGTGAGPSLLASVAGLTREEASRGLAEGLRRAVLAEGPQGCSLRHALAAEAVLGALPAVEARRLHLRAAEALEADGAPAAVLARHYRAAGRRQAWVRHAEAAADEALALGDDHGAFNLLDGTLDVEGLPRASRPRIALKLARAALHGLEHGRAVATITRVLQEPLSRESRGELRLQQGWLLLQGGDAGRAFEQIRLAVEDLEDRPDLQARALATLAMPWVPEGTLEEHRSLLRRAELAAARHGDPHVRAALAADRAYLLTHVGDPGAARAVAELRSCSGPPEILRQVARGLLNLTYGACDLGHRSVAQASLDEARALCEQTSYERLSAGLDEAAAVLDWVSGRWRGLDGRIDVLRRELGQVPHAVARLETISGLLALACGDPERAERSLRRAVRHGWRTGVFPSLAAAASGLAELRLEQGDPAGARSEVDGILSLVMGKGVWAWGADVVPVAVRALASDGRVDEAGSVVGRFADGLTGVDAPAARAALVCARGWLADAAGDHGTSARRFLEGAELWEGMGRPYRAAAAREAGGSAGLDRDDESGAEHVRDALETYTDLGAQRDANRARRLLRRHGAGVSHRRGRKGYGLELSPREREAALLAAEGRTNREIAERLFLSPRTVSDHVSRAVRKLGVGSREHLTADRIVRSQ